MHLARSRERYYLDWLKQCIVHPQGNWQCTPYAGRKTRKLTGKLPLVTASVWAIGTPTAPIPIEEQPTDRIPLEL